MRSSFVAAAGEQRKVNDSVCINCCCEKIINPLRISDGAGWEVAPHGLGDGRGMGGVTLTPLPLSGAGGESR